MIVKICKVHGELLVSEVNKAGKNMKINNIDDMRLDALNTLEKLSNGEIDVNQAGVTAKLYESVMSMVKAQLQVAVMLRREPNIPFMGDSGKGEKLVFENKAHFKLLEQKQKIEDKEKTIQNNTTSKNQ